MPVIADVTRTTLNWTGTSGPPMHNVLHFQGQTGTEVERCDAFVDGLAAGSLDYISSQYTLTSIDFLPLDGTTPSHSGAPTSPPDGGGGSDFIVEGCAILSLHTDVRGPRGRGRVFLPALPEAAQSGGTLTSATALAAAWMTTLGNWDGTTEIGTLVVASYEHADYNVVDSITVPQIIGTQRGRLIRLR